MEKLKITNDFVFKRIFAKKGNEEILKDLLISILEIPIEEIEVIAEANLERKLEKDKLGILDIKAILDDKTIVNIEVQVINYYNMVERSLFYWSALYHESLKAGENFEQNKKVITINILNFNIFKEGEFHEIGRIRRDYKSIILTEKLEMHFIQLPRFIEESKVNNSKVNKKLRQWMHFISNQDKGEIEMAIEENEEIKKASKELEYLSGDEEERRLAYLREKALRDEASNLIGAKKEGAKEKELEIAKKMLEKKIDLKTIIEVTGLTKEKIEKLK